MSSLQYKSQNNSTPPFPSGSADDSDENLSSNTLAETEENLQLDSNAFHSLPNSTSLDNVLLQDTMSDQLSTGTIGEEKEFFVDIPLIDEDFSDNFPQFEKEDCLIVSEQPKCIVKGTISSAAKSVKPVCKISKKMEKGPIKSASASKVTNVKHKAIEKKPVSSIKQPHKNPNIVKKNNIDFRKVGLLKQSNRFSAKSNAKSNNTQPLADRLADEVARSRELESELDRCKQHMQEAAIAYADLGKLALMERERAEVAEKKLKEVTKQMKELEKRRNSDVLRQKSLMNRCDEAITSFAGDHSPGEEPLDKIELSLKNVLTELTRLRLGKELEPQTDRNIENVSPIHQYCPNKNKKRSVKSADRNVLQMGQSQFSTSDTESTGRNLELQRLVQQFINSKKNSF